MQHFFNASFLIFIIRAGIQILSDHPRLYWTRHSTPGRDWFRIQKPVPEDPLWTAKQDSISLPGQVGLPGLRHSIGLARWWHLCFDVLWLLNGLIFYVLLFAGGRWQRLVPTSWEVFPNALSTLIQYLSLNWPAEHGWVAYNGLQLIAYFVTVFIAAPLALITGLGMSPALSARFRHLRPLRAPFDRSPASRSGRPRGCLAQRAGPQRRCAGAASTSRLLAQRSPIAGLARWHAEPALHLCSAP